MPDLFLGIAIVLLASGLVLRIWSRRYLTERGRSIAWYSPKAWCALPSDCLTKKGERLYMISLAMILLGVVLYLVGSCGL